MRETDHNGFPVIVSAESQYLVGFVLRRDLSIAISKYDCRCDRESVIKGGVLSMRDFFTSYLSPRDLYLY